MTTPEQDEQLTVLDWARRYVARGWSVIPISKATKRPLVKWAEYQSRRATDAELRQWFDGTDANIAVLTGPVSGIVVLDVDTYKGGDADGLLEGAPTPLVADTPRGGKHLLYHAPSGSLPNAVEVLPGVDVRGTGGYVLVHPSTNSEGKAYTWSDPMAEPGPLPSDWVQSLQSANRQVDEQGDQVPWVVQLMEGVTAGGRNDAAARLAGYFLSKGMAKDIVLATLETWDERNTPPLGYKELHQTVESVWRKERRTAKGASAGTDEPGGTFSALTLDEFMRAYGAQEVQWTVPEWLPRSTVAMVVAAPESYKTWITFDLAVSVASGKDFLGKYPVERQGPVLIVQQEDFTGATAERLGLIINARCNPYPGELFLPPSLPIYLHTERQLRFDNKDVLAGVEEFIARVRPELVIIDPMYSVAVEGDEFLSKTVQHMRVLKQWRDEYKCSFMLVHHTRKGASDGTKREDGWGSQFLNAFLETGYQVRRTEDMDTGVQLRRHFKAARGHKEIVLEFNIDTEIEYPIYEVAVHDGVIRDPSEIIVDLLAQYGHLTVDQLQDSTAFTTKKLRDALRFLQDEKKIHYDRKLRAYKMGAA